MDWLDDLLFALTARPSARRKRRLMRELQAADRDRLACVLLDMTGLKLQLWPVRAE